MGITGHEIFTLLHGSDEGWFNISLARRQQVYDAMAEKLNARHLTPAQSVSHPLTGQELHEVHMRHDSTAWPWDRIGEKSQQAYNAIAEHVNQHHIAPLQGVIQDWQKLMQDYICNVTHMSVDELNSWYEPWQTLKQRTEKLLTAEQKG